jgi:hypothetical protein
MSARPPFNPVFCGPLGRRVTESEGEYEEMLGACRGRPSLC